MLIIGAGLAGLFAALKLAPRPVTVISPEAVGSGASSAWAQAGIAAALGPDDSPLQHAEDTVAVAAGLGDLAVAQSIAEDAAARVAELNEFGAAFDREATGHYRLAREAGHRFARIVGVRSDGTGQEIMRALAAAAESTESIQLLEGYRAIELIRADGGIGGAIVESVADPNAPCLRVPSDVTVLAAGGLCGLYARTTTPPLVRGQALGMAARAGAVVMDAEFVQFHPTALAGELDPSPLASEALRGAGATLVDGNGQRFMVDRHPDAELAPRDVVAREIFRVRAAGGEALLDARAVFRQEPEAFPRVRASCEASGIDPTAEPIPVAPAAHFHIGGVQTDLRGRTSLPGLFACGETAATGLHGGNRLGSNGLLEAVVLAGRIAEDISGMPDSPAPAQVAPEHSQATPRIDDATRQRAVQEIRTTMDQHVGVVRDREGLVHALQRIESLTAQLAGADTSLQNMLAAATLVAVAALRREESRGAHYRSDFPEPAAGSPSHSTMTLDEAESERQQIGATA